MRFVAILGQLCEIATSHNIRSPVKKKTSTCSFALRTKGIICPLLVFWQNLFIVKWHVHVELVYKKVDFMAKLSDISP